MAERCQPPDPNPRAPRFACPPDAVDCHVHVYGPEAEYPVAPAATVIAPDALPSALNHLHTVLGVGRTVLVQPSTYGFDNRRHLDALTELGRPARLVGSVPFDIARGELDRLTAAGACGARIAIGHAGGPTIDHVRRLADRVAPVGWHIEFHVRRPRGAQVLAPAAPVLRDLPVDLCIAHFASIEPGLGLGQADVDLVCELLAAGRCWLKLSGGYRLSAAPPYRDLIPPPRGRTACFGGLTGRTSTSGRGCSIRPSSSTPWRRGFPIRRFAGASWSTTPPPFTASDGNWTHSSTLRSSCWLPISCPYLLETVRN